MIKEATEFLNPGQTLVTVCDQPLSAIAKVVQWNWPTTRGENVFFCHVGGLDIEMVLWTKCGDLLAGSSKTARLTEAWVRTR